MGLFSLFKWNLPIELHENALYSIINMLMDASKDLKAKIVSNNLLGPLIKFASDLYKFEFQVLNKSFVIVDYGIKINPEYDADKIKKGGELTIGEM